MLPRPPETFLGRDSEVRRLLSFHPRRRLVFLKGMAGIGKTSLALSFLKHLREQQPDLRIACVRCLEGWGFDDLAAEYDGGEAEGGRVVPLALQDRMLAFVQRLNQGQQLLFLDDVHVLPEAELAMLLGVLQTYLDSHVLMTSRRELPLSAVDAVDICQEKLGGLAETDARQLLQSLIELHGDTPELPGDELERLTRDVAGHPFMLRLLASLVVTRSLDLTAFSHATAAELRQWLLGSVMGEVGPDERTVLQVIASARTSVPSDVLAAVAGVASLTTTLTSLERKFLVERESRDRVRIHQVLAEHVRSETDAARQRDLHASLAHQLRQAGLLDQAFHHAMEAGHSEDAASILATIAGSLCSRGLYLSFLEDVKRLETAGAAIPPQIRLMQANALSVTGRGAEGLDILRNLAATSDDRAVVADALTGTGGTHINSGQYLPALACYQEALALCDGDAPEPALYKCLNYLGLIHGYRGEMRVAFEHLRRSEALARREGNEAARAHTVRIQATIHALAEEYDEALRLAREAIDIAVAIDSVRIACFARYAAALAYIGMGDTHAAREVLMIKLADGQRNGDLHVQAYAHLELAQVAWEEGALEEAASGFAKTIRTFQEQGDGLGVAMTEVRLARLRLDQGRLDEVPLLCKRTAHAARERGNPRLEAEAVLVGAEHALEAGALDRALSLADEARRILTALELPVLMCEAVLCITEAHARRLEWTEARASLTSALPPRERGPSLTHRANLLNGLLPAAGKSRSRKTTASGSTEFQGTQARRVHRFEQRVVSLTGTRYRVRLADTERVVSESEATALRQRVDDFDLFLDEPERVLRTREKGDVPVFRKRIISRLLMCLVRAGERGLTSEELVPQVWGFAYEGDASALEVRKAMSRLRDLLETDRARPRVVLHQEGLGGGPGRYRFALPANSCAILLMEDEGAGSP